jgi:myo-inositol-1(or 4)-monophosphatase
MIDWLRVCRAAGESVADELRALPSRLEREPGLGAGVGGDETTAVDAAAERAIVRHLEELHREGVDFTLVSEELGERRYGEGADALRVVVDPIDGSVNAKRGIPFFSVSIAVAEGPTMADVVFGWVGDFGAGEEWTATRGGGAVLDDEPLQGPGPKEPIEILSFEATTTERVAERAPAVQGYAARLRVMGSLAISLCHLAAGRVDAVCSLKECRSVDVAAAQLLVRERGLALELVDDPPFDAAPLDLVGRSRIVAGASPEVCAELASRLRAGAPAGG